MDEFEFSGHYCMVMTMLGPSLYEVLKENDYAPFPMAYLRPILRNVALRSSSHLQLLEAMQFLHSFGLTHTDLKLENLLFSTDAPRVGGVLNSV